MSILASDERCRESVNNITKTFLYQAVAFTSLDWLPKLHRVNLAVIKYMYLVGVGWPMPSAYGCVL